jgi:hypothetical protein
MVICVVWIEIKTILNEMEVSRLIWFEYVHRIKFYKLSKVTKNLIYREKKELADQVKKVAKKNERMNIFWRTEKNRGISGTFHNGNNKKEEKTAI